MTIDIKESIIFKEELKEGLKEGIKKGKKEGLKEGIKKGKKEGLKEGIKKGKKEGLKEAILLDLKFKFDIDKKTETEIKNALDKIDDLKKLWELKRVALIANTLNDFIKQL